ncbi:MAG: anthranilate phosphoribosyltransferase [Thermoplasmata archaeon]
MHKLLDKLVDGFSLSQAEAEELMMHLIESPDHEVMKAVFLTALAVKGETPDEIAGIASAIKKYSRIGTIPGSTDIVGTGGDMKNTINASTCASIVAASMGIRIVKHGNRAVTGTFGSADFLARLGYDFSFTREEALARVRKHNFLFIMAPMYNDSFSKFSSTRKKIRMPTIFNIMGPITNPADPEKSVIGSISRDLSEKYAKVLSSTGKTGMIVTSSDGLDEISTGDVSSVIRVTDEISEEKVDPVQITGRKISLSSVQGKSADEIFRKNLEGLYGKDQNCASFIAINAAPALFLNGMSSDLKDGYEAALNHINSGYVRDYMERLFSNGSGGDENGIEAGRKDLRN